MLVVADSGSTKADWKLMGENGTTIELTTIGFNPNYHKKNVLVEALEKGIEGKVLSEEANEVYYYGSGCWDKGRNHIVEAALQQVFKTAKIEVHHDMLGAARATCGDEAGIACILGTGSNSLLYDGKKEVDNITNLGYLVGDEGSGSHLGKKLIRGYFYREMPAELIPKFEQLCPNGKQELVDKIYGSSTPAVYLASFGKFMAQNKTHPYLLNLIEESFDSFIRRHVCKYENHQNLPIHFVGSVAFYFKNILNDALKKKGLRLGIVIKRPIENLAQYHFGKRNSAKSPVV